MKYWHIVFATCMTASTFAFADTSVPFPTSLSINNQLWTLKANNVNDNIETGLYLAPEETIANPSAQLTIQRIKIALNKDINPDEIAKNELVQFANQNYKSTMNLIESRPSETIADFQIQSPQGKISHDLQRIVMSADHSITIIMHYNVNKADMGEVNKVVWVKALKNISIAFRDATPEQNESAETETE